MASVSTEHSWPFPDPGPPKTNTTLKSWSPAPDIIDAFGRQVLQIRKFVKHSLRNEGRTIFRNRVTTDDAQYLAAKFLA